MSKQIISWENVAAALASDKVVLMGECFVSYIEHDTKRQRALTLFVRVDARDPKNVRVDRGTVMGWEAIDGGQGFDSVAKGKAHARKFFQEVKKQGTQMPKMEK